MTPVSTSQSFTPFNSRVELSTENLLKRKKFGLFLRCPFSKHHFNKCRDNLQECIIMSPGSNKPQKHSTISHFRGQNKPLNFNFKMNSKGLSEIQGLWFKVVCVCVGPPEDYQPGVLWRDSLVSSEEVRLPRYCVEERSIDLVFGKACAQLAQGLWGIPVHGGLTEDPVPVTCR